MAFWGLGIVVAPILGPGARRLADRQLQLALGLLHQPAGRHHVAHHDEAVHLRSAVPAARSRSKVDYWGIGMLAVGIGALQIVLDKGQEEDWFSSHGITALAVISAVTLVALIIHELVRRASDRRSARLQGTQLRGRRVPDDRRRLRAVRQHGAAADLAADAARLSGAPGGHRDGAARHRLVPLHADRRDPDGTLRPAEAADGRAAHRRHHRSSGSASSTCRRATGTSSGRSSSRASACRCSSCRSRR